MLHTKKNFLKSALAVFCMVSMLFISEYQKVEVYAASGYGFIFLSAYEKTLKTGDTYCLSVVSSGSKKPTFTSSDSKVVSVNTYGKITAKKAVNNVLNNAQKLENDIVSLVRRDKIEPPGT